MTSCPHCGSGENQVKAGLNGGRQRYKCTVCQRRYLAETKGRGCPDAFRRQALALYAQGAAVTAISREIGVTGQSVRNWVRASHAPLPTEAAAPAVEPEAPTPARPPGKRRPTINDVARQASVSRSTVSNILNNKGRMSEETRARVNTAIEDLHFTPSALIRALHRQRTRILGVLVFGLTSIGQTGSSITPSMLGGLAAAADAAGHNLLLFTGWERGAARNAALEFLDGHIDGLIWVAPALHEPALQRLAEAGLPVVALLSRHVPDGIGYVNADNIGGVSETISYLVGMGHRRIAYIGSDHDSNFQDRRVGYRVGLTAQGLEYDPRLDTLGDRSPESNRGAVAAWLALPSPPTAIIVPNDGWAEEIGTLAREAGRRVPEDISITGFDDGPNAPRILGGLTSVRQPFRRMGQLAGERLLALIGGAPALDCRLTVPCELIVRASTAPPGHGRMG